jgi:RNA polymerase sigma factor (sigma-70 family)
LNGARLKRRLKLEPAPASRSEDTWTDTRLVRECLRGNEDAWAALIDKYKNLIYSIPIKRGFAEQDASDVFQRVCLLLLADLGSLRDPRALPAWLIRVTSRECSQWSRQERPHALAEPIADEPAVAGAEPGADELLAQLHEEQSLRDALLGLSPRCRQLIQMLFFEAEARPYQSVASSLGLATGSIGFIRAKCLERLRRALDSMDFPSK